MGSLIEYPPLLDGTGQTIAKTLRGMTSDNVLTVQKNAAYHNSIYRGSSLGTSVTAAQYKAIENGTFDDMYVGDYWTINSTVYRIAHFNYWYGKGDDGKECLVNHVVIVPDANLTTGQMNSTNITTGGYVGSNFYTGANSNTAFATVKSKINTDFGEAHVLKHRELLTNAVTSGSPSGVAWYDSTVELMNEVMVYGHTVWCKHRYDVGIDDSILALFQHDTRKAAIRAYWWLRGVFGSAAFACVHGGGRAYLGSASASVGVRPCFGIIA